MQEVSNSATLEYYLVIKWAFNKIPSFPLKHYLYINSTTGERLKEIFEWPNLNTHNLLREYQFIILV